MNASAQNISLDSELVNAVVEGIMDNKGHNISVLDLRGVDGASTDFFVICDGSSTTQVDSIADSVEDRVRQDVGEKPAHIEGRANAEWVLMDYHDVVVHVFLREQREFYDLETLWSDAKRTDFADDI